MMEEDFQVASAIPVPSHLTLMYLLSPLSTSHTLPLSTLYTIPYSNWIANYSIKFDGCASIPEFEKDEGLRSRMLAKFKLCPSDSCGSCHNAGEYVIEMRDFVEAYQNAKLSANEYNCEVQLETCEYNCENGYYAADEYGNAYGYQYGDDNNGDSCQYQCMADAGMDYCNQDNDDDGVDMNELSECRALGDDDNNNQNNNNQYQYGQASSYVQYYVGVHCTSSGVYAGTFTDSLCSKKAPAGTYETYSGGYSLPTQALVSYDCISCKEASNQNADNQYGNDYYDQDSVSDSCEELYQDAGKCESSVKDATYPDTTGCDLIHSTLPRLERAFSSSIGSTPASVVLAWVFGLACVGMAAYIYTLLSKNKKVDLSHSDGVVA